MVAPLRSAALQAHLMWSIIQLVEIYLYHRPLRVHFKRFCKAQPIYLMRARGKCQASSKSLSSPRDSLQNSSTCNITSTTGYSLSAFSIMGDSKLFFFIELITASRSLGISWLNWLASQRDQAQLAKAEYSHVESARGKFPQNSMPGVIGVART